MEDIAHWLNNENVEEQKDEVNESITSLDFRAEVKRRCIVMSVCLADNIVDQTNTVDSLAALQEAIHAFTRQLKPTDFICFNIGNSSRALLCDKQQYMENWQRVMQDHRFELKLIADRQSSTFVQSYIEIAQQNNISASRISQPPVFDDKPKKI